MSNELPIAVAVACSLSLLSVVVAAVVTTRLAIRRPPGGMGLHNHRPGRTTAALQRHKRKANFPLRKSE